MDYRFTTSYFITHLSLNTMLDKKATEATHQIFGLLQLPNTTFHFVTIQPLILELLVSVYLQGRKDQVNKVVFEEGPGGSITFPTK